MEQSKINLVFRFAPENSKRKNVTTDVRAVNLAQNFQ
jgi:hypothetical protein